MRAGCPALVCGGNEHQRCVHPGQRPETTQPIPGDRPQGYGNYGFPLSKEAGGWGHHSTLLPNNNPPVFLGGHGGYPQGTLPVNSTPVFDFSVVPHAVGQTGSVQFNASGFTATSGGTQLAPQQASSSVQFSGAAAPPPAYSPAWTSIPVDTASRVNFVKFDVSFNSQSGAMGLLTVYWNNVQIGQIDERYATTGNSNYIFAISSAYLDKSNSLGFRLDQFSGVLSSIAVSNVAVGLSGLATQHKLTIASPAGGAAPVLTLTGALGYTYIVESSTDLINWVQMAGVTLDTAATSLLNDPSASTVPKKFYRAVSP